MPIPITILAFVSRPPLDVGTVLVSTVAAEEVVVDVALVVMEDVVLVAIVVLLEVDDAASCITNVGLRALIPEFEPLTSSNANKLPLANDMLAPSPIVNS